MSDEISLETRVSSAYVQGQLAELIEAYSMCSCCCSLDLHRVLNEWKQAEAELQAQTDIEQRNRLFGSAQAEGESK